MQWFWVNRWLESLVFGQGYSQKLEFTVFVELAACRFNFLCVRSSSFKVSLLWCQYIHDHPYTSKIVAVYLSLVF
jgi:hypothetical protein